MATMGSHVEAMLRVAVDAARDLRLWQQSPHPGEAALAWSALSIFPGFVPEYIRPLFCVGKGPFRWVALSGDPEDIYRTDGWC